jgi:hypothetical protein
MRGVSVYPRDLLDWPRPRAPEERLRSRREEWVRQLAPVVGAMLLAALAFKLPLAGPRTNLARLGLALLGVVLLQVIARRLRRRGGWPAALEEAALLYRAGDLSAASAQLTAVLRGPHPSAYRAVALAWRGMIALRRGEPSRALELFAEVARSGHTAERGLRLVAAGIPGLTLLAAAMEGPDARVLRWTQALPHAGIHGEGTRILAEVYAALRRGDLAQARTRALHGWPLAEGSLAPAELRALRVLLAFTESEPGSSAAWRLREGARPSWPGELDYLGYGFPALATYLVVHGFSERRDG